MALKKSAIYAQLWQSCNALRGGIDASQYKDYVLALLFVKYISDKYTGEYAEIKIPTGASFADTESGKSKGQFYTPAEVSRIMASIIGIAHAQTSSSTTVYDPTCGSGSLLLKVGEAARTKVSLYGQEKDVATQALARMNLEEEDAEELAVLHGWQKLHDATDSLKKDIKAADRALDAAVYARIPTLTEEEVKTLVIDDKWLAQLEVALEAELEAIGQMLTSRVKELAERYATPLPELDRRVDEMEAKVRAHLQRMGFAWEANHVVR